MMKIKDRVLIIEDEDSISSFIAAILNANNYDAMRVCGDWLSKAPHEQKTKFPHTRQ